MAAISEGLSEWIDFKIFTSMDDAGHDLSVDGVRPLEWMDRHDAEVFALSNGPVASFRLLKEVRAVDADVFYMNSLFHPVFSLPLLFVWRLGALGKRPVVVAPRGELDPGALAMSHRKKNVVLALLRVMGVLDRITWHATSPIERDNIRECLGSEARVVLAPTLRSLPIRQPDERVVAPPLRVVFMSRINRKKNLETAVQVVARHRSATLTVIGPVEDVEYWESVLELTATSGLGDRFVYEGVVEAHDVEHHLPKFDLFLLPTRGENFGHVILEALAAGLPVLLSDLTPWNRVEASGAGWVRPVDDVDGMVECLTTYENLGPQDQYLMRKNAARVAQEYVSDPAARHANRDLFLDVAGTT